MTLQADVPSFVAAPFAPPQGQSQIADSDGISIGQIVSTLWRRRWVLLSTIALITLLGFIVIKVFLTPSFTSTTVLVLAARHDDVVDLEQSYMKTAAPNSVTRSEADVLQSRTLVDRVIDREDLMDDPEFNLYAQPYKANLLTRWGVVDRLPHFLQSYLRSKPLDPSMLDPAQLKYNTATRVLKAWDVEPDAKTYSVKLNFTSVDAGKAARLANAFASEYFKMQIDDQATVANQAAQYLTPQLDALSKKVADATRAVEQFRATHNIVDYPSAQPEGNTLALQQIQSLAQDLSAARTKRAQLEAAQQEVARLASDPSKALSAPVVAAAPVVENIRVQEVTAAAHLADLTGTYGDRHPLVVSAKSQLQQLRQRLDDEVRVALQQLAVETRQAQANEAQLQARMDQLTAARRDENNVMPQLQQLESEQQAAINIYNTFVQGAYRALTQDGVPTTKGRIVQYADPLDWPSFPNMLIFMAVIFIAASMIGVGVVYVLEARDKSFRTASEIEEAVQIPVLGMTLLEPQGFRRLLRRRLPVSQQVMSKPTSAMSELVRLAGTAITLSHAQQAPKIIMVTSSVPAEGKSTFALMLARQSAHAGKRVIVVEAEMRKPTFGDELSDLPAKGLAEYLLGRASLDEVIGVDRASGAHFIAVREQSKFSAELLGGAQMRALLQLLRQAYDLIVLDTPPTLIAADALQLGRAVNSTVLVVKWGSTPRHMVLDAVRKLRTANVPVSGIVMTQVDAQRYRSYGHGQLPYEYAKAYYAA